jgi:hypothetical protein
MRVSVLLALARFRYVMLKILTQSFKMERIDHFFLKACPSVHQVSGFGAMGST